MLFDKLNVYQNSSEVKAIQDGLETASNALLDAVLLSQDNVFVRTATNALYMWETMLGLPSGSDESNYVRRSRIISKLRGAGTATVAMIKQVAESYTNGEVDVIENFSDYSFTIKFISQRGVPDGINLLKRAIEEIKPAHLHVYYEFQYNTHDDLGGFTHAELSGYTHQGLREEDLV